MKNNIVALLLSVLIWAPAVAFAQDQSAVRVVSIVSSDSGIVVTVNVTDAAGNSKQIGHRLNSKEADIWLSDSKAVIMGIYDLAYAQLALDIKMKSNITDVTKNVTAPTLDDYKAYKKANP